MFKQEIMFNSIYKMSFTIVCIYIYYPYKASKFAGKPTTSLTLSLILSEGMNVKHSQ